MFKRLSILFLALIFILSFSVSALAAPKSNGSKSSNGYKERQQLEERQEMRERQEIGIEAEGKQKEQEEQQNDGRKITDKQGNASKEEQEDKKTPEYKQEIREKSNPQERVNLGNELQNRIATQENNSNEENQVRVEKQVKIRFHGKEVKWDMPPVIKEGRTLVPVRAISEGLGADVNWDAETKTVTITKDNTIIVLKLNSNVFTVNGQEMALDVPAQLISNRTFVPIRFIAQALNQRVSYDEQSNEVNIEGTEASSVNNTADEATEMAP
ncbi:MAG: hypothetical protein PWP65_1029 [Clostridia bacterium]|nr:hypothetical protein [Clostridia bacterium]